MAGIRFVAALSLAGLVALVTAGALAQEDGGIRWETDLAVARDAAHETGRPLMVVFR